MIFRFFSGTVSHVFGVIIRNVSVFVVQSFAHFLQDKIVCALLIRTVKLYLIQYFNNKVYFYKLYKFQCVVIIINNKVQIIL